MFENLRLLYRYYGGIRGVLSSGYFWVSLILSFFLWKLSGFGPWYEIAHSTLPSLAGFSIAAFAIIFAILTPEQITVLVKPKGDDDKPPLIKFASIICHTIFIQILTILLAGIVISANKVEVIEFLSGIEPNGICWKLFTTGRWMLGFLGYFLLFYSWLLVLAAALSIFRMLELIGNVR